MLFVYQWWTLNGLQLFPMAVTAIDLDAGQNGYVTFTSSDDNFTVSTDGKQGKVYATRSAFTSLVYSLICILVQQYSKLVNISWLVGLVIL